MSDPLGRLERVELRDVWSTEDRHFTPWLAEEQNIAILGQTLNMELEVEEVEQYVGNYRADIVCRDTEDSSLVLIENQFEKTDHKHLGQILTYTAGTDARTIIWIAERFAEEHREALDWFNQHTSDEFRFFGLEVELWRIGQSAPAPKFNVISKPNDWTRTIRRATSQIASGRLSATQELYLRYWQRFKEYLEAKGTNLRRGKNPRGDSWLAFSAGRAGFLFSVTASAQKKRIGAELYIGSDSATKYFELLMQDQPEIDAAFGEALEWMPLPTRTACRVARYENFDPRDEDNWDDQHEWLAARLEKFQRVFENRVKALDLADLRPEEF